MKSKMEKEVGGKVEEGTRSAGSERKLKLCGFSKTLPDDPS